MMMTMMMMHGDGGSINYCYSLYRRVEKASSLSRPSGWNSLSFHCRSAELFSRPTSICIIHVFSEQTNHVHLSELTYSVSQKKSPLRFSAIFSQTVGNFLSKFYTPVTCSYLR